MAMHQGAAHNENEDNKNCAPYDPRGIIEKGRLCDVQCRSPLLRSPILELRCAEQGKYEEERKKKLKGPEERQLFIMFTEVC